MSNLLTEAENAFVLRDLDHARQLYERILQKAPTHHAAKQGLLEIEKYANYEKDLMAKEEEGDEAQAERKYEQAEALYKAAYNLAGQHGFLRRQPQLEAKAQLARKHHAQTIRMQEVYRVLVGLEQAQDWPNLVLKIDQVLDKLPSDSAFEINRRELQEKRSRALGQGADEDKLRNARTAFEGQRFREVLEIVESMSSTYARYHEAIGLKENATRWIRRIDGSLERAQEAYNQQKWPAAFAELQDIRQQFPENPDWRRQWREIGERYGEQRLDEGRQANTQRDFATAARLFAEARDKAYQAVLDVYNKYEEAQTRHDEADDLHRIALLELEAQQLQQSGQRQEALSLLEQAQRRIDTAMRQENRDYISADSTVKAMIDELKSELRRLEDEQTFITDGQRLLADKRLKEAEEAFRKAYHALNPTVKDDALRGVGQAEHAQRLFNEAKTKGEQAASPEEAVQSFQNAYDRWPYGPDILRLLERALIRAGQDMLAQEKGEAAIRYADRALDLNPNNREAQAIKAKPGLQTRVNALLQKTAAQLADIGRQERVLAQDFNPLIQELEGMMRELSGEQEHPDLYPRLHTQFTQVREHQAKWELYNELYAQAEENQRQGQWELATGQLEKAIEALAEATPPAVRQKLGQWRNVVETLQREQARLAQAFGQAQTAYEQAAETGAYETPQPHLTQAAEAWHQITHHIQLAKGGLPDSLAAWQPQLEALQRRASLALECATNPNAREALVKLEAFANREGFDPTLTAVQRALTATMTKLIPTLKVQAQKAEEEGNLADALDIVSKISELQPDDEAVRERLKSLQQKKIITEMYRKALEDYDRKTSTDSMVDAAESLRNGISNMLGEEGFPNEVKEKLQALLQIQRLHSQFAFGEDVHWQSAQTSLGELAKFASKNKLIQLAYDLTDKWLKASRPIGLKGLVKSTAQMGSYLESYRHSLRSIQENPYDQDAISDLGLAKTNLIASKNESAKKRLQRAESALKMGDFTKALEEVSELADEIYGSIEIEFPDFFNGEEEVEENRIDAAGISAEAAILKDTYEKNYPLYVKGEKLYGEAQYLEAQQVVSSISSLKGLPRLQQELTELKQKIEIKITEQLENKLNDEITKTDDELENTLDTQIIQKRLDTLRSFPKQELAQLSKDAKSKYDTKIEQLEIRLNQLGLGNEWHTMGQEALQAGDYEAAERAFQRALEHTPAKDTKLRTERQMKLDRATEEANKARRQKTTLENGQRLLLEGKYNEAQQELRLAQELGAKVEELITAARAGISLQSASDILTQQKGNWKMAEVYLRDAVSKAQGIGIPHAEDILTQAHFLKAEFDLLQEQAATDAEKKRIADAEAVALKEQQDQARKAQLGRINSGLAMAQQALYRGDLDQAEKTVSNLLGEDPQFGPTLALMKEIKTTRDAEQMYRQAEEERSKRNYTAAKATLETILSTILPGYPQAVALLKQVEQEAPVVDKLDHIEKLARSSLFTQAHQELQTLAGASPEQTAHVYALISQFQLAKAKQYAHAGQFQEARQLTYNVINADPQQLQEVQELIAELEAKILLPIENRLLDGEYDKALDLCQQALTNAASPDIRTKLESLQETIVERRANGIVQEQVAALRLAQETPALDEIVAKLEWLLRQTPRPIDSTYRSIQQMRYQVLAKKVRLEMEHGTQSVETGNYERGMELLEGIEKRANEWQDEATEAGRGLDRELNSVAFQLSARINQLKRTHEQGLRDAEQGKGQELLERAQIFFKDAKTKLDLANADRLAEQALQLSLFKENDTAQGLSKEIKEAVSLYDSTEKALKQSRDHVLQQRYEPAQDALHLNNRVSPLLQTEYEKQRRIVRNIVEGKKQQHAGLWKKALESLRIVIKEEPSLKPSLEQDLERCQREVMKMVIEEAEQSLVNSPPDFAKTRQILSNMEQADWYTEHLAPIAQTVLQRAESAEYLAQAIALLQQPHGSLLEVEQALREAGKRLPSTDSGDELKQWELACRILREWETHNDWQRSQKALEKLYHPLAVDLARLQSLKEIIGQKEKEEEANKTLTAQLRLLQTAMQTAQQQRRYEDVAKKAGEAYAKSESHSVATQMVADARQWFEGWLNECQRDNAYGEAHRLGSYVTNWMKFEDASSNQSLPTLIRRLADERQTTLESLLNQAEESLRTYNLDQAEKALAQAEKVVAPDNQGENGVKSPQLGDLQTRLLKVKRELGQLEQPLKEFKQLLQDKKWEQAQKVGLSLIEVAPQYTRVVDAVRQYQQDILVPVRDKLNLANRDAIQFGEAMYLCQLGLKLNQEHPELKQLAEQIETSRNKRGDELLNLIRQNLRHWNIAASNQDLDQALTLYASPTVAKQIETEGLPRLQLAKHPDFPQPLGRTLVALIEEWNRKQSKVEPIKLLMEEGMRRVHQRNYAKALDVFSEAQEMASDFGEARLWQSYVSNLSKVLSYVEGEKFDVALQLLEATESILGIGDESSLTELINGRDYLRQERQQAVYDVSRLIKPMRELTELAAQHARLSLRTDYSSMKNAAELLNKQFALQDKFISYFKEFEKAPTTFVSPTTDVPQRVERPVDSSSSSWTETPPISSERLEPLPLEENKPIIETPRLDNQPPMGKNDHWGKQPDEYQVSSPTKELADERPSAEPVDPVDNKPIPSHTSRFAPSPTEETRKATQSQENQELASPHRSMPEQTEQAFPRNTPTTPKPPEPENPVDSTFSSDEENDFIMDGPIDLLGSILGNSQEEG